MERLHRAASRAISTCLSSSPIPLLSEASLPPLRVTLTHFVLSSYERALRLPTSYPISELTRLGVKPRLWRFSWRILHPLMLPSTSPRKSLLACPPLPPWNMLSSTVESTLSFLFSHSNPLSLTRVRHSLTLTFSHLTIWCSEQMALFLFLLAKAALAYLPTALFVVLRPLFPFPAGPVCLSLSAKACAILQALCWSRQHQQACHFSSLLLQLSPPCSLLHLSFHLNLSGRNCVLSPHVLSGYNGSPGTRFTRGTTRLISWPDVERYPCPLKSFAVSLLLCLVSTLFFSRTEGVLSHQRSSTHRLPRFPPRYLCSPSR